jgi:hypothetical protein
VSEEIQKQHPGEHVAIDKDWLRQFCKPGAHMNAVCYRSRYLNIFQLVAGMPRSPEMPESQKKVADVLKGGVTDAAVNAIAKIPMRWDMHGMPLDVDEFLKRCA